MQPTNAGGKVTQDSSLVRFLTPVRVSVRLYACGDRGRVRVDKRKWCFRRLEIWFINKTLVYAERKIEENSELWIVYDCKEAAFTRLLGALKQNLFVFESQPSF